MTPSLRVLLVDDNPDDRALVIRQIRRTHAEAEFVEPTDAASLARLLASGGFHLVITDFHLRWSTGIEVLRAAKRSMPLCPVIMFTGTGTEEIAVEAMKSGLDDYVIKSAHHISRLVVAVDSVLERTRQRQVLQEAELRLRMSVEAADIGLWDWDIVTGAVYFSPEWKRQLGYAPDEIADRFEEWEERLHPADRERVLSTLRASLASPRSRYSAEFRLRHRDGSYRWIMAPASVLRNQGGEPVRMLGAHLDLTERKQLDDQLRQAQKMEILGQLAGGIAHDFNNLLTALIGHSELILMDLPADSPLRVQLQEMRRTGERGAQLTRQLLAFSRRQAMERRVLDLNGVVAGVERMLQRMLGEHIGLEIRVAGDSRYVLADAGQLEQVLMNLAINARDAMPAGGRLTIGVADVAVGEIPAGAHPGEIANGCVALEVADSGSGIEPALLPRIFEPFFTTKPEGIGTGLGLSTVEGIVRQSGGTVTVKSEPGHGTTFRVFLPQVNAPAAPAARPEAAPEHAEGGETVLVVEDEEAVRRIVEAALTAKGFRVILSSNGAAALESLGPGGPAVDLLLTDLVMPGMNGVELAARFVEHSPQTRVLYMSGYLSDSVRELLEEDSRSCFLQKPFSPTTLVMKVRETLDTPSGRVGSAQGI